MTLRFVRLQLKSKCLLRPGASKIVLTLEGTSIATSIVLGVSSAMVLQFRYLRYLRYPSKHTLNEIYCTARYENFKVVQP